MSDRRPRSGWRRQLSGAVVTSRDGTTVAGNGSCASNTLSPSTCAACSYRPDLSSNTVRSGRSRSGVTIQ